jgi:hypothetical protein
LFTDGSFKDGHVLMRLFLETKKNERGGRLKIKIRILLYGNNSWTVALRQMKFGRIYSTRSWAYEFYLNNYFV